MINDLIGTPYKLGGRCLGGLDCWGLVLLVYQYMGIAIPDFWTENLSRQDLVKLIRGNAGHVAKETNDPRNYDMVCDETRGHIGVWINSRVLHADRKMGVVFTPLDTFKTLYPDAKFFTCLH